jgi:hypothetical protein
MATIEFQDVTKRLGNDTLAVDNLTLDVREGESAGQPFVLPRHCTQNPVVNRRIDQFPGTKTV